MKNLENCYWDIIDGTPFLKNYLTEIERTTEPELVVEELLGFYKEVDEMIWEVTRLSTSVFSY